MPGSFEMSKRAKEMILKRPITEKIRENMSDEDLKAITKIIRERLALWKCPYCGKLVRATEEVCPNCGTKQGVVV